MGVDQEIEDHESFLSKVVGQAYCWPIHNQGPTVTACHNLRKETHILLFFLKFRPLSLLTVGPELERIGMWEIHESCP